MRRISTLLALLGAVLVSACLPVTSKVPAGSTVGFKADADLLGTWIAKSAEKKDNDNGPAYLHFVGNDDGTMTAILVFPPRKQSLGEWGVYTVRAAQLGANHVLNAVEVSNNGKPSTDSPLSQASILFLMRPDGHGHVLLSLMDEKAAAAAIQAGDIAGDVGQGSNGDVHITADAAALDKFMATPKAAALFKQPFLILTRATPVK